jgi:hypothetical protein
MLNPKKARDFITPTSKELGIDSEFVEAVVDFYWKEIRKALSNLSAPQIFVANLGTFRVKHWELEKNKNDYQSYIDKLDLTKMTFQQHAIKKEWESRIENINQMIKMVDLDKDRKKQIKQKRHDASSKKDLE